ncbi:MAG: hypothetical protein GXX83_08370 [Gaiellales bacterium]|nr:hypothetical protein [Gaiellales bacterium]
MDQLIAALERDAAAEVEDKLQKAQAEADELMAGRREKLAQRLEEEAQRHERDLRTQAALAAARARHMGRSDVLRARDALLSRVRTAAEALVASLEADPGYRAALAGEVREAVGYMGEGPAHVRCRPALARVIGEAVAGLQRTGLSVQEESGLPTGFVIRAADGREEVDARLVTRLDRMWPELSLLVLGAVSRRGWLDGEVRE